MNKTPNQYPISTSQVLGNFTCSACGLTFPKVRSDEEALAEYEANFGKAPRGDVVCDDCHKEFMGDVERGEIIVERADELQALSGRDVAGLSALEREVLDYFLARSSSKKMFVAVVNLAPASELEKARESDSNAAYELIQASYPSIVVTSFEQLQETMKGLGFMLVVDEFGPMTRDANLGDAGPVSIRSQGLQLGAEPAEFGIDLFKGLSPMEMTAHVMEAAKQMSIDMDAFLNGGAASKSGVGGFMMNVHQALGSFLRANPMSAADAKALAQAQHQERVRHRNEFLAKLPSHRRKR